MSTTNIGVIIGFISLLLLLIYSFIIYQGKLDMYSALALLPQGQILFGQSVFKILNMEFALIHQLV